MIEFVQAITLDALPPFATVSFLSDDFNEVAGRDYDDHFSEASHTTPVSVARVWRGAAQRKSITLIAAGFDLSGLPLTYRWTVVRGPADAVKITTLDGNQASIEFTWRSGGWIVQPTNRTSTLSTVMLTVHNGVHYSPPCFINVYHFAGESRSYGANGALLSMSQDLTVPYGQNWLPQPTFVSPRTWSKKISVRDGVGKLAGWEAVTGKSAWIPAPQ